MFLCFSTVLGSDRRPLGKRRAARRPTTSEARARERERRDAVPTLLARGQ